MPKVTDPDELAALLLAGDYLARSCEGWCLVRAGRVVEDAAVRGVGPLVPAGAKPDQLPGFPADLAQTWRLEATTSNAA